MTGLSEILELDWELKLPIWEFKLSSGASLNGTKLGRTGRDFCFRDGNE